MDVIRRESTSLYRHVNLAIKASAHHKPRDFFDYFICLFCAEFLAKCRYHVGQCSKFKPSSTTFDALVQNICPNAFCEIIAISISNTNNIPNRIIFQINKVIAKPHCFICNIINPIEVQMRFIRKWLVYKR